VSTSIAENYGAAGSGRLLIFFDQMREALHERAARVRLLPFS